MTRLMQALIKQGLLTKRVHRIRFGQGGASAITLNADTPFSLLTCDDEPNYDLTTDGTNVAECHPGAKIVAVQLVMTIFSVPDGECVEWIVGRDPDSAITASSYTIANLYTADITTLNSMLRKNVWGAGHMISSDGHAAHTTSLNITKALRRSAKLNDGDSIRLVFTMSNASGNGAVYIRGRIITVGP